MKNLSQILLLSLSFCLVSCFKNYEPNLPENSEITYTFRIGTKDMKCDYQSVGSDAGRIMLESNNGFRAVAEDQLINIVGRFEYMIEGTKEWASKDIEKTSFSTDSDGNFYYYVSIKTPEIGQRISKVKVNATLSTTTEAGKIYKKELNFSNASVWDSVNGLKTAIYEMGASFKQCSTPDLNDKYKYYSVIDIEKDFVLEEVSDDEIGSIEKDNTPRGKGKVLRDYLDLGTSHNNKILDA